MKTTLSIASLARSASTRLKSPPNSATISSEASAGPSA